MKKTISFFLFGMMSCYAASPFKLKLSKELLSVDPQANINVIVRWRNVPTNDNHEKVKRSGGKRFWELLRLREAFYTVSGSTLLALANDPDVEYIAPDRPITAKLDYTAAAVKASVAWARKTDGSGVTVAVIDSGMSASSDLGGFGKIVYSEDFTSVPKLSLKKILGGAPDAYGHGQHVAGIIGADPAECRNCQHEMQGIALGVKFVNLKVLEADGSGSDSAVIAAIDRAIELKDRYDIRVINLSLGRPVFEKYTDDPLCQAVEEAWKAGIVVVVAAGNDGRDNSMGINIYKSNF